MISRSRILSGAALAAALSLGLPAVAHPQSSAPDSAAGSVPGSLTGSVDTGSLTGSVDTSSLPGGSLGSSTDPSTAEPPEVTTEVLLDGLTIPWDVVRAPDGTVITGERGTGRLIGARPDGSRFTVSADLGPLYAERESGLMGMAVAADFDSSRELYTCLSRATASGDPVDNRVIRWRVAEDFSALTDPQVIVSGIPLSAGGLHSGCSVLVDQDNTVWIGTGDAFTGSAPQDPDSLAGKILHVTRDGAPAGPGGSIIATSGHRNVQGLAQQPGTGRVFAGEHGPDTDDEVNLLRHGGNYGWNPNRGGRYDQSVPMTDTTLFPDAVGATWSSGRPTLAPAGIRFLDGPQWGEWDGAMAVAMLKTKQVILLRLSEDGTRTTDISRIVVDEHGRLRSITEEPGGSLLVTTSNGGGRDQVVRIRPA